MVYLKAIITVSTVVALSLIGGSLHAQTCAPFDKATQTGNIGPKAVNEASGLATSRRHKGHLWVHNDSGDTARLFLMKEDGSYVATVELEGIVARDFEDVAVGACAEDDEKSCVYVADIGDNRSKRKEVVVYRFEEPSLPEKLPAKLSVKHITPVWFTYPGGPRDAETVMVHPKSAAIYVVEKTAQRDAGVYRVKNKPASPKKPTLAVEVGQLRFGSESGFGKMVTAGDISPDGTEFTVRTYLAAYTFCANNEDFESAVSATPVMSRTPFMIQSEALGYDRSGQAIWVTSERRPSPLYRVQRTKPAHKDKDPDSGQEH